MPHTPITTIIGLMALITVFSIVVVTSSVWMYDVKASTGESELRYVGAFMAFKVAEACRYASQYGEVEVEVNLPLELSIGPYKVELTSSGTIVVSAVSLPHLKAEVDVPVGGVVFEDSEVYGGGAAGDYIKAWVEGGRVHVKLATGG